MRRSGYFSIVLFGLVGACSDDSATLNHVGEDPVGEDLSAQGQSGTTLSAAKTANPLYTITHNYQWALDKHLDPTSPTSLNLDTNESGTLTYDICATRTEVGTGTLAVSVSGNICVRNGGSITTSGLTITDQLECRSGNVFVNVGPQTSIPTTGVPGTVGGELPPTPADSPPVCFPYNITLPPDTPTMFTGGCRNRATVTILNHSGRLGMPFGPTFAASFTFPTSPTPEFIDLTASVLDEEMCPDGFMCDPSSDGPFNFPFDTQPPPLGTPLGTQECTSFTKQVTNTMGCGSTPGTFSLTDRATLTAFDSGTQVVSPDLSLPPVTVPITTPACPPSVIHPGDYCTYTKGAYGGGGVPAQILASVFPSEAFSMVRIGENTGTSPRQVVWTQLLPLQSYLTTGGPPSRLTFAFRLNPIATSQTGGGNLASQTATLTINSTLNFLGVIGGFPMTQFADLVFCNPTNTSPPPGTTSAIFGSASTPAVSIQDVLNAANAALSRGGTAIPSWIAGSGSFGNLNAVVTSLNEAFDECEFSNFAQTYLCLPPTP